MATWLQITGDKVTNAAVFSENKTPESLGLAGQWIQHDTAGIGWGYAGGVFTQPVAPVVVPQTITRRQGRLALLQAGLLEQAEAFIEAGGAAAAIEYEASTWERHNPFLTQVWEALGGDSQGLDDLFTTAASL